MTTENSVLKSVFSNRFSARSLYVATLAVAVFAVACALFLVPNDTTAVQASSNDQDRYTSDVNNGEMISRAINFGDASKYTLYSKGGISDNGSSLIKGSAGTSGDLKGLSEGQVQGDLEVSAANTLQSKRLGGDVDKAFSAFEQLPCTQVDTIDLDGKTFGPGVYCMAQAHLISQMTLDAGGDSNARFLFHVLGAVTAGDGSSIQLANGALATNAYFYSETGINIGANSLFHAGALSKGNIDIQQGATVDAKVISSAGQVNTLSSLLGQGTGFIEICKFQLAGTTGLEGLFFEFIVPGAPDSGFGANRVRVPLGGCSGPISLPVGTVTVGEVGASPTAAGPLTFNNFTLVTAASPQGGISNINTTSRTFDVAVSLGTAQTERLVNVTNRYAITGWLEICKRANDADVTGTFEFTTSVTGATRFPTPVGQCTSPLFVVVPTTAGATSGTIDVTEIARNGFINTGASTVQAGRLNSFTPATNTNGTGTGGTANVTIVLGNPGSETTVNFFNSTVPGTVKVCKIAGAGIPLGTRFNFTVAGQAATATAPPLPGGTASTQTVTVAAGPAAQGGFCTFATGTFVVGSTVTITELLPPVDPFTLPPNGEIRVSNITTTSTIVTPPGLNLTTRVIGTSVRPSNGTVVTYTDFVFVPTLLKICKIAGAGVAPGTLFTFDVTLTPADFPFAGTQTVQVAAGAAGTTLGNCAFVNGPFTPVAGPPPIGTYPQGSTVAIVERPAGTTVESFAGLFSGGPASFNAGARTLTMVLSDPGTNVPVFVNTAAAALATTVRADFNGDGISDYALWNLGDGSTALPQSAKSSLVGQPGDLYVPGDYDGDRKTDRAFFTKGGTWNIELSTGGTRSIGWGTTGDIPMPADYNGDGKVDIGVYRPSTGVWYLLDGPNGSGNSYGWGISTDIPVAGDFDGDGKADIGVFRPSDGMWYLIGSRAGGMGIAWGANGDRPVPADYDGDGKVDLGVFRPSQGTWYIARSSNTGYDIVNFGAATDILSPGDYDGDGKYDIAVYRPSNGTWYVLGSQSGMQITPFGGASDVTAESRYIPY